MRVRLSMELDVSGEPLADAITCLLENYREAPAVDLLPAGRGSVDAVGGGNRRGRCLGISNGTTSGRRWNRERPILVRITAARSDSLPDEIDSGS